MARMRRAFSLIELLICVVIVAILSGISLSAYMGALDQGDLKYAAPAVAGRLAKLQKEAEEKQITIKVEFLLGTSAWKVTRQKGEESLTNTEDMKEMSLIKRKLRFLRYEWPDGADTPATFTFLGKGKPDGGAVYFGTARAETAITVAHGSVYCEHGVRQ